MSDVQGTVSREAEHPVLLEAMCDGPPVAARPVEERPVKMETVTLIGGPFDGQSWEVGKLVRVLGITLEDETTVDYWRGKDGRFYHQRPVSEDWDSYSVDVELVEGTGKVEVSEGQAW